MNDLVKKYLQEKYKVENPDELVAQQYEESKVSPWAQALSGFGQALAGKDVDLSWADKANKGRYDSTIGQLAKDKIFAGERAKEQQDLDFKTQKLASDRAKDQADLEFKKQQLEIMRQMKNAQLEQRGKEQQDRAALASQKEKELSAVQAKQRGNYEIGNVAEEQFIKATSGEGSFDPTSTSEFFDRATWTPGFLNALKDPKALEALNAQDSWVETFLREASGAAIPESERESYAKIYFPQPGDSKQTVLNKQTLREQKMNNSAVGAGVSPRPRNAPQTDTKTINGKQYKKVPGGWEAI